jgi:hypothetical protein
VLLAPNGKLHSVIYILNALRGSTADEQWSPKFCWCINTSRKGKTFRRVSALSAVFDTTHLLVGSRVGYLTLPAFRPRLDGQKGSKIFAQ